MLVFALTQLPEMTRGLGVALQKYKEGHLRDAVVFAGDAGVAWPDPQRVRTLSDMKEQMGKRGDMGRPAPAWAMRKPRKPD